MHLARSLARADGEILIVKRGALGERARRSEIEVATIFDRALRDLLAAKPVRRDRRD